jgi:nitrate reductase NapE component
MENKKEASINTDDFKIEESAKIDLSKSAEDKVKDASEDGFKNEIEDRKNKAKIFLIINLVIFIISIIALIGLFYFIAKSKDNKTSETSNTALQSEIKSNDESDYVTRKIDGIKVLTGEDNNFLMALMIDNHSDARPPSGLASAHLVFEAEVEGGITRIMGVFSAGQELTEIGPIRSARPYFVDWARELSALYAHVGGSPDALVKIQQDKILDINEFFNEHYFWRDDGKAMPHNVYTSSEKLEKYLSSKSADRNRFVPWFFKDDTVLDERPDSSSIKIDYKLGMYKVEWKYDKENNNYLRYVAGDPHKEKSGEIITAKNVLVQVALAHELDDKLRLEMNNIGNGKSLICMDGKCQPGTWEKKHPSDRTRFYAEDGREVKFNRGMTWVQVVRPEVGYLSN